MLPGAVRIRDSKRPDGALVTFTAEAWHAAEILFQVQDAAGRGEV